MKCQSHLFCYVWWLSGQVDPTSQFLTLFKLGFPGVTQTGGGWVQRTPTSNVSATEAIEKIFSQFTVHNKFDQIPSCN